MGNPFIYWGISLVCLLLGALSQLWGNIFWLHVLGGLSGGFLLFFAGRRPGWVSPCRFFLTLPTG